MEYNYLQALEMANNDVTLNKIRMIQNIIYYAFYALNDNESHAVPTVGYDIRYGKLYQYTVCMPDTELFSFEELEDCLTIDILRDLCRWINKELGRWDREVMKRYEDALLKN